MDDEWIYVTNCGIGFQSNGCLTSGDCSNRITKGTYREGVALVDVQVGDGLRPPRRPRRALDEGRVEEPVPAAVPEAVVPEPDVRGADSICT